MIVRRREFQEIVGKLSASGEYGLDSETTGLGQDDRLFSVILSDDERAYYFNFNERTDHTGQKPSEDWILPRARIIDMTPIFENPESLFYIQNAKFDMRMLAKEGLRIAGTIHCTEALARVQKNTRMSLKLAHLAKEIGLSKDEAVEEYIKKHKLTRKVQVPGKDKPAELKFFDQVPFSIMTKYGENDAVLHRAIGRHQVASFDEMDATRPKSAPAIWPLVNNERRLTKVCFGMERTGIRISRSYAQGALSYTQQVATSAMKSFEELTGIPWTNSPTTIVEAFKKFGVELPKTPTGRPSTDKKVLEAFTEDLDIPLAKAITAVKKPLKMISTYYSSFLYFAGADDIIHPNMRQGQPETGRFSYSDPNLQNVPKEDDGDFLDPVKTPYLVRSCFIPREDFCFVPIDFDQQEFKMMLDYAGEMELIRQIRQGHDVHTATAELLGISRKQAKTINFGLLYGMGDAKLARALGISLAEAKQLKALYFAKLPRVEHVIRQMRSTGKSRGYVWNWAGRRLHVPQVPGKDMSFVLSNHIIQGGGADVVKFAMPELDDYILGKKLRSRMLIQVHDEILFEVHKNELGEVAQFKKIMEQVYQPRHGLPLTVSPDHSWKSWGFRDKTKGAPSDT